MTIRPFGTGPLTRDKPGLRVLGFPTASGISLSLATQAHSPARSSKRTVEPVSYLPGTSVSPTVSQVSSLTSPTRLFPPGFRLFSLPITGSFHLSVALLVRYRARGVFSLGGWLPPASRRKSNRRYSGTRVLPNWLPLRGCHPLRPRTSTGFGFPIGENLGSSTPHLPEITLGIWFGLLPFRSPLLRESLLLSFPAGIEMFHFPAFPLRVKPGVLGFYPSGSSHSGIRGSMVACTSPRHLAACHPLLRLPSPGIHRAGSWGYM